MIGRRTATPTTVLLSFEAPERSAFQAWRGGLFDFLRRGLENRLLELADVIGYVSELWDRSAPTVSRGVERVTRVLTNRRLNRWVLAWTLATLYLCY